MALCEVEVPTWQKKKKPLSRNRAVIYTRLLSQSSFSSRRKNKVQSCVQREEKLLWALIYRAAAACSSPPHPPFCLPRLYQPSYCPLKCFYLQTSQAARSPVLSFSRAERARPGPRPPATCTVHAGALETLYGQQLFPRRVELFIYSDMSGTETERERERKKICIFNFEGKLKVGSC